MSYETRIKGFVSCFVLGWIMSFCSVIAMSFGNINGFVLLYSFGNVIAMFATMFLMGPWRQIQNMCARIRIFATFIFIGMLITTIVVAFKTRNVIAVLMCIILQFFAGLWYSISYIPYGRSTVRSSTAGSLTTA
jgi:Got1/Sft2-like family